MRAHTSVFKQLFLLLCILLASIAINGSFAQTAEAAVAGCRSDPLVVLSDGTILDVTADISTAAANVTGIDYTVHGPHDVRLVEAIRTPTIGIAGKETFTYYADSAPNQYVTETLVRTTYDRIGVVARTTFANVTMLSGPPLALQYKPVSGFNDQVLRTILER